MSDCSHAYWKQSGNRWVCTDCGEDQDPIRQAFRAVFGPPKHCRECRSIEVERKATGNDGLCDECREMEKLIAAGQAFRVPKKKRVRSPEDQALLGVVIALSTLAVLGVAVIYAAFRANVTPREATRQHTAIGHMETQEGTMSSTWIEAGEVKTEYWFADGIAPINAPPGTMVLISCDQDWAVYYHGAKALMQAMEAIPIIVPDDAGDLKIGALSMCQMYHYGAEVGNSPDPGDSVTPSAR